MKGSRVASRYAKALLDLSVEQKTVDVVYADMQQLSSICRESRELNNLLSSPIVDAKKKVSIFEAIFGKTMHKISLGFMSLVIKNSRENVLGEIADSFIAQYKRFNHIIDVTLTSAIPLEKGVKDKVLKRIGETVNGKIELNEKIDPSLIGGFIIRFDDQQIDASIANQLSNLKNIMLN